MIRVLVVARVPLPAGLRRFWRLYPHRGITLMECPMSCSALEPAQGTPFVRFEQQLMGSRQDEQMPLDDSAPGACEVLERMK
jgi:hypothetical protein